MEKYNKLLDYISVKGSGERKEFWDTCHKLNIEKPWLALENFSSLAHLDAFTVSEGWSCSQPSLAILPNENEGVLCGARSEELFKDLEDIAEIRTLQNPGGPDVWKVSSENGKLRKKAEKVGLLYNDDPNAYALAKTLPPISKYTRRICEESRLPNSKRKPQWWDPKERDWKNKNSVRKEGLWLIYELYTHRRVFILKENGSTFEVGDLNAAKFFVDQKRDELVSYDSGRSRLTVEEVKKGIRLPRLYSRVFCLCSGKLPEEVDGGKLIYKSVPQNIAEATLVRLGCGSAGGLV